MANETAEFSSHVPREEYEFFKEMFPQYGATKWFINTALVEFNERVRNDASVKNIVAHAIDHMLETSRLLREATAAGESGTA